MVKNMPATAGDLRDSVWIPGLARSPGGGHGNPVQCSCLEDTMDGGYHGQRGLESTGSQSQT